MNNFSFRYLRPLFFGVILRPLLMVLLGFNVRNLQRLVLKGGHIIAANHNSHLDALVLLSLFQLKDLKKVKVVAARDYFCATPLSTWFTLNIIGAIPIDRQGGNPDAVNPILESLREGYTVIMFPEGSRGEAERRQPLRYGIAKIVESLPDVSVTPVFTYGLGKSLPRGEALLVPFVCQINVGEPIAWDGSRERLVSALEKEFDVLACEIVPKEWK